MKQHSSIIVIFLCVTLFQHVFFFVFFLFPLPYFIQTNKYTVELIWVVHLWNHEIMFETGVHMLFELMSVSHSARSGGIIWIFFRYSLT